MNTNGRSQFLCTNALREANLIPASTRTDPIRQVVVHGAPGRLFLAFDGLDVIDKYSISGMQQCKGMVDRTLIKYSLLLAISLSRLANNVACS